MGCGGGCGQKYTKKSKGAGLRFNPVPLNKQRPLGKRYVITSSSTKTKEVKTDNKG